LKRLQRTIETPVELSGIGVNSGEEVTVTFKPSPAGSGIRFVRTDLPGRPEIPATPDCATSRLRRTALRKGEPPTGGAEVQLVEHVLATCYGMRVDNVIIEVSGLEMPVGDGSASIYVDALEEAGIVEQDKPRREVIVAEPISIAAKDASLIALPSEDGLRISYTLDYRPTIQPQYSSWRIGPDVFRDDLAPARTFCLEEEIEELRSRGMGKGATYLNTLVIGRDGPIENTLRFEDEACRHKVLDIIGDLCLAGVDINAHIIGVKSGHALNARLAERIRRVLLDRVAAPKPAVLDVRAIRKILPHRYPFLMVDKLIELVDDRRAIGIKNVSINEEFFQGHWPDQPIMPGVLQLEAMAQVGGLMFARRCAENHKLAVLLSMDNVKFRRTVVPGDQLILEMEASRVRSRTANVHGRAMVGGDIACEADITYMLVDKPADDPETV
jgi:UDP-3-O-[3-hydroxymyristoyl] N-acetylglucosamine deacetylase / 3-hydroxyacyl-[acyl-carrier-protein] dehydratase